MISEIMISENQLWILASKKIFVIKLPEISAKSYPNILLIAINLNLKIFLSIKFQFNFLTLAQLIADFHLIVRGADFEQVFKF